MISIVIPALNEERALPATLAGLGRMEGEFEIIVVDGGSSDATPKIAREQGVRLLIAPRGRGSQLGAGAAAANGDVLWFLHADTLAPVEAARKIQLVLEDPAIAGGNFALRFDGLDAGSRFLTRAYPYLRKLGLCYGDSGFFVRRQSYLATGGFREYPVFEDLDLMRRLKRRGGFVHLDCALLTSARRWRGRSFSAQFARWTIMQVLYWVGVSPHWLGRLYANPR